MTTKRLVKYLSVTVSVLVLGACANPQGKATSKTNGTEPKQVLVKLSNDQLRSRENTMSVLWYQNSDEAKALYLQGYQVATNKLQDWLNKPTEKPYSIILDIDETVLDNSPFQVSTVEKGTSFTPESWDKWVQKKAAKPVAGAKDFLQFADQHGVQIYYVSDRTDKQVDATMENLKNEGLPVQGKDHFLFLEKGMTSKESRRQKVQENTNLIMLFGDNLVDFAEFSKVSTTDRSELLNQLHQEFGSKFIIFPNPMYGSWESAVYQGKKLDSKEQMKARKAALKGFD
ncbi:5'-nucleotidase, lipoprotein e(P4) family [Streptococcus didelphis]|uniref:5'-nucleotidase, lipoprotein e(P4) family n=1 Tax=Streptococcus didelphis TaxID=102886 RepID=A0ABY9LFT7_9STRE|nr:5'-nucleotidase, lipoprotein e(P4) family [Streptococcus didelphis]WMB27773.1 5'-nucleotidase, lipoprotein e(P4) family [Streptococcus didelphis]WMB29766.1 5'-nucleotidase, lipoprotein e(P4) family [Streptococcus didelphis]